MRMPPEGKPFVPPNPVCPTEQLGHIPDLSVAPFELFLDTPRRGNSLEAGVRFIVQTDPGGDKDIVVDLVESSIIELSLRSTPARRLQELIQPEEDAFGSIGFLNNAESPIIERMRLLFCNRVANCPGVVDGECWALGKSAVKEVIEEALKEDG